MMNDTVADASNNYPIDASINQTDTDDDRLGVACDTNDGLSNNDRDEILGGTNSLVYDVSAAGDLAPYAYIAPDYLIKRIIYK